MADLVKVIIAEINGVDLEDQQELLLVSSIVPFDNSTNGFIADNVQDAIEEAAASSTSNFSFKNVNINLTIPSNQQMVVYQNIDVDNGVDLNILGEVVVFA